MSATPDLTLWDPAVPYPAPEEMPDLAIVTHVAVERAEPDGYHYLHETSLAWHRERLVMGWANHRQVEVNSRDEVLRGRWSDDGGLSWGAPSIWAEPPLNSSQSYNHPVLHSEFGRLWGFFTRWDDDKPSMEVFVLDEDAGQWQTTGAILPNFLPFRAPMKMADGNWIMGGELHWDDGAVAISHGDDFTSWESVLIPRPEGFELQFPEVTLLERGEELVAIMRPRHTRMSPASVSRDYGRSWSLIAESNYPMGRSQPYCGRLSTGQQYLLCNHPEAGRTLLSIAVTAPGEALFRRVWKLRHQQYPVCRLLGSTTERSHVGNATQWSYPAAVEHDGNLYISYTHGKEDAVLSIIPIRVLGV